MADQPAPVVDIQSEPPTVALSPTTEPLITAETQSTSASVTTPTSNPSTHSVSAQVAEPNESNSVSTEADIETTPSPETECAPTAETEPILTAEPETMTAPLFAAASSLEAQAAGEGVTSTSPPSRNLSAPHHVERADSSPAALPSQEETRHDPSSPMISDAIASSPSEIKSDPMSTSSPSRSGHSKSMSSAGKDDDDDRPSVKHIDSGLTLISDGVRKHIHEARDSTFSFMKNEVRSAVLEAAGDITKNVHKLHDLARGATEDSGSAHSRKSDVDASPTSIVEKGLSRVKTLKAIKMPKVNVTRPNLSKLRASSSTVQKLVPGLRSTRGEKTEAPS